MLSSKSCASKLSRIINIRFHKKFFQLIYSLCTAYPALNSQITTRLLNSFPAHLQQIKTTKYQFYARYWFIIRFSQSIYQTSYSQNFLVCSIHYFITETAQIRCYLNSSGQIRHVYNQSVTWKIP